MTREASPFKRRIFRVPGADYMHEWDTALDAHDDRSLDALRRDGFDAVWIRGIFRDLVRTSVFPELAPESDRHLSILNSILDRCACHQLEVFLYLNEPLGFPADDPFWQRHPDLRGEPGSSPDDFWEHSNALCTSTDAVRAFLRESSRNLFRLAPGLAGVFLITASEHHTHCYSHDFAYQKHGGANLHCPRCRVRTPAEIIGEIVRLIQEGAHESKPRAEIIAWNWSWSLYEPDPQSNLIAHLPRDISLLADFERGGSRRVTLQNDSIRIDREIAVDEYSLAYVGPSPRFTGACDAARARGIPCHAKLQLGTTHEIATVPNLPLIPHLYRKFARMRELHVRGFLGCWNFGSDPSLNTFAVGRLLAGPSAADETQFLHAVASEYFPGCDSASVVAAWHGFCRAMEMHPFSHAFIYLGPVNYALVYPWTLNAPAHPLRGSWHVRENYGDQLEECCGPFTLTEIEALLGELVARWQDGVKRLEAGLSVAAPSDRVTQELGVARIIGHQLRSACNLFRFYLARAAWLERADAATAAPLRRVIGEEIANLSACLPVVESDPRLGWHRGSFPRPHRFYDAPGIRRHREDLEGLLARIDGR